MVVSKNKTMKLGAALITATLGATGIACDGDTPPGCLGLSDEILAEGDFEDTYWACELTEVGGDDEGELVFFMLDDGTADSPGGDLDWEFDDEACALILTGEGLGDGVYEYAISGIEIDGDDMTFELTADTDGGDYTFAADCARLDFMEP